MREFFNILMRAFVRTVSQYHNFDDQEATLDRRENGITLTNATRVLQSNLNCLVYVMSGTLVSGVGVCDRRMKIYNFYWRTHTNLPKRRHAIILKQ